MKIAIFEVEDWERETFADLEDDHEVVYREETLTAEIAGEVADAEVLSAFIYSDMGRSVLEKFERLKLIATRSTGFDPIALDHCNDRDIKVANVPTYSENTALMRNLLVSDLGGGHNKRMELNLAVTALGQLLWLDETASVFPAHLDREALADALREFVDEEWQDPATGYWGAWYRNGGDEIRKTNDLSITFHIISYRGGDVALKQEIGRTTGAIRNVRYPFGWDTGGMQNNHHAYDIARIANLTWEHLDPASRSHASANLFLMLARSLAHSISGEGKFDSRPFTTVAEAYYFGISFFEEVGLFVGQDRHIEEKRA